MNHLSINSILFLIGSCGIIYSLFKQIYKSQNREYFDNKLSSFEFSFMKTFALYFLWGGLQQAFILGVFHFLPLPDMVKAIGSIILFAGLHIPNIKLTVTTFLLACLLYPAYYLYDIRAPYFFALIHAFGGTLYKMLGWEMRVLWNYPKDS